MFGPAFTLGAYLLGSVSFGLVAAKRSGVDLRAIGSGNIGATNVGRGLGKQTGRVVLLLDAIKGVLPAALASHFIGIDEPWTAATGAAAVVGHCFPLWHRFRGGKGAATSAGVMLTLVPPAGLVAIAAYLGLKKLTRRASIGSLGGALLGSVTCGALVGLSPRTYMCAVILAVVVIRHANNIARLLKGQEPPS